MKMTKRKKNLKFQTCKSQNLLQHLEQQEALNIKRRPIRLERERALCLKTQKAIRAQQHLGITTMMRLVHMLHEPCTDPVEPWTGNWNGRVYAAEFITHRAGSRAHA
jgi:hypothetical protein